MIRIFRYCYYYCLAYDPRARANLANHVTQRRCNVALDLELVDLAIDEVEREHVLLLLAGRSAVEVG